MLFSVLCLVAMRKNVVAHDVSSSSGGGGGGVAVGGRSSVKRPLKRSRELLAAYGSGQQERARSTVGGGEG